MITVSDREAHLVIAALAQAITSLSDLPQQMRPSSDIADMKKLLSELVPNDVELEAYMRTAERRRRA